MTWSTKVHTGVGSAAGNELVIESGGTITILSGGILNVKTGGIIQANGSQASLVTDLVNSAEVRAVIAAIVPLALPPAELTRSVTSEA